MMLPVLFNTITMKNILIAGGSGLVGKRLSELLQQKGYKVAVLSRQAKGKPNVFEWNIKQNYIQPEAINFADAIINLAGAGVVDKRWTEAYKKDIYDSRIQSTQLLSKVISENKTKIKTFVNASAIGIYGNDFNVPATEQTPAAPTFLGKVCNDWENATKDAGVRTVIIRTGIVLSSNEGFVGQLKTPIKLYAGCAIAGGKQMVSWIHIDDLCNMYIAALENESMQGPYNAVAPNPVSNQTLTHLLAKTLHRKIILPNVPTPIIRLALGEMADMLIGSQPVSSQKIQATGFRFRFDDAQAALKDLLQSKQ